MPLSIVVEGPADSSFSLAIVNRAFSDALARRPECQSRVGLPGPDTTHVVRNMYPPRLDAPDGGVPTFFYFAWEDSRIPVDWANAFNRHFTGLLVPSAHVRDVVRRSGVVIPVAVVPYGVDAHTTRGAGATGAASDAHRPFHFLHVSTGFPRKGLDVLVRAFTREFSAREDVVLVLKTLPQYDHVTARLVRYARWTRLRCPEIRHIDRDLDDQEMRRLYADADCLVHPARAEGFGLPIAEAMLADVPVIASDYSGHTDFCTAETALMVPCRMAPSRSPFVVAHAEWGEPDEDALRRAMRNVFERRDESAVRRRARRARAHMQSFTWDRAAERAVQVLRACDDVERVPLRAGMMTTWNERCGIAEYSRALIDAAGDAVAGWTILAPHRSGDGDVETASGRPPLPMIRCWRDAWPVDVTDALAHARRLDLDLLHVQAHLNTWDAAAVSALADWGGQGRSVIVSLHSVRGARPDAATRAALRRIERILVHTEGDREGLRRMGVTDNVAVLPHGYPSAPARDVADARSRLGITGAPVIGTYGFLRPHKGTKELIRAIARLRNAHPDISLLAVTAVYPTPDSSAYLDECRHEAVRAGLDGRCHFLTGFLDPDDSIAALQACDVVALPYQPTIDSSSAAVRVALAAGRPVVTTAVPVFDDVKAAVHQVPRTTPRVLAAGLARVLEDETLRAALAAGAAECLAAASWTAVGGIYRKLLRAGALDRAGFGQPYPMTPDS
ncbi:MAG: glycosyltransferase [Vicinamibacterales bacterium]